MARKTLSRMERLAVEPHVYCSFCGKHRDEVHLMIAGPQVQICDECVGLCVELVEQHKSGKSNMTEAELQAALREPTP